MKIINLAIVDDKCGNPECKNQTPITDDMVFTAAPFWLSDPPNSTSGVMTCGGCGFFNGQPLESVAEIGEL